MEVYGFTLSVADLWLLGICGALIMALIGYRLSLNLQKHNTFITAASTFRSKILAELEGLYPITHHWDESMYPRFSQSIPKIESAAAEFKFFVPFYHSQAYDKALKNYCEYCNEITQNDVASYSLWPDFPKPRENPREQFKNIVEHLLSFAEEK
jgi:hypothetical protein